MLLETTTDITTSLIGDGGIVATLLWLGRQLIRSTEQLIEEARESRVAMDSARKAFLGQATGVVKKVGVLALPLLLVLSLTSCAGVDGAWVNAEVATFNAIAPTHVEYLRNDTKLDPDARELEIGTLILWRSQIRAHGGEVDAVDLSPGETENDEVQDNPE